MFDFIELFMMCMNNHNHSHECYSALSTSVKIDRQCIHYSVNNCRNKCLKSVVKSRSRMKVSDVWGNQILGPQTEKVHFRNWVCVHATKAALVVEERSWRCPDSAVLNCTMLLRYAGLR